ncbi:MAG: hypothetical protein NY202_02530 [Mollicutes bacterium UO1]
MLELSTELSNLHNLIPVAGEETSEENRLTAAQIEAYNEKKPEVDQKELSLLKKIVEHVGKNEGLI